MAKIIFWAFLLASRRSRRATGYAIASVLTHFASQTLRMPNAIFYACLCEGGAKPRPRIYSQIIQKQYYIKNVKRGLFTLFSA